MPALRAAQIAPTTVSVVSGLVVPMPTFPPAMISKKLCPVEDATEKMLLLLSSVETASVEVALAFSTVKALSMFVVVLMR